MKCNLQLLLNSGHSKIIPEHLVGEWDGLFAAGIVLELMVSVVVPCRERTVASAVKGYGASQGKATSASTASCWSINGVTSLSH